MPQRMFNLRRTFSAGSKKDKESTDMPRNSSRGDIKGSKSPDTAPIHNLSSHDADWIVRKTEDRVAEIVARSPFIQKNTTLRKLPRFSHDDFELGDLIAKGGFCEVRAIKSFKVDAGELEQGSSTLGNRRQYVIKHLSPKLLQKHKQLAIGAKDLVMEAYALSALEHENILSIKGYSDSGVAGYSSTGRLDGFFLILPRLDKTLHKQLHEWRSEVNKQRVALGQETIGNVKNNFKLEETNDVDNNNPNSTNHTHTHTHTTMNASSDFWNCLDDDYPGTTDGNNDSESQESESDGDSFDPDQFPFFVSRIQTAVEIANAIAYCHRNRILFRDLKPANIGYDFQEDRVKIFDFGLALELPPSNDPDAIFKLPGNTGTARYMAPEVIRSEPYGFKADVYSFCTLFHEIMALIKPFEKLDGKAVKEQVAIFGNRPPIDASWPLSVRKLLRRGFSDDMDKRPHMEEILDILEDLVDF